MRAKFDSEEHEVNPYCFVRAVKALRVRRRSESFKTARAS